jgi:hypothetical protein
MNMVKKDEGKSSGKKKKIPTDVCPHCGVKLSRWEQVLLNVDRALLCKNCWYRIILNIFDDEEDQHEISKDS